MPSDLVLYAFALVVLMFFVGLCSRLQRSGKSAPVLPKPSRPKREPKPFAGLTRKPECALCDRESVPHSLAPSVPPPRMSFTRALPQVKVVHSALKS